MYHSVTLRCSLLILIFSSACGDSGGVNGGNGGAGGAILAGAGGDAAPDDAIATGGAAGSPQAGAGGIAGAAGDAAPVDATDAGEDASSPDIGPADAGSPAQNEIENSFGFTMRRPSDDQLSCVDPDLSARGIQVSDIDYLCTFDHGDKQGTLYIRTSPVACVNPFAATSESQAYLASEGKVEQLESATYDWGGTHHNDELTVEIEGTKYRYYHSSFGFGFRACHPPDCMMVLSEDGTVAEDGCTPERTLAVSCVVVSAGESYDASDLADTFMKCPGDSSL